jgi:uncharacterized protein YjbI with pentapeptide repeats
MELDDLAHRGQRIEARPTRALAAARARSRVGSIHLERAAIVGVTLRGVTLHSAHLEGANLLKANLPGTVFAGG